METELRTLSRVIEAGFADRARLGPETAGSELRAAVQRAIELLDSGALRVAEPGAAGWRVQQWLKKAVLLYFRIEPTRLMTGPGGPHFDKVPLKYAGYSAADFEAAGVRVVPPATVRRGAYIAPDVVLMPCYVNIGAYVGGGTLVDTWATIGSCAQIGRNVHISGGVGIGGVLEPVQASPTIIEDDCFIGARSEVVEGVIVERGAVLSMGVYLGQSTPIYDRERDALSYGRVPAEAVVVPGSLPASEGRAGLYCAVIVKRVDVRTRSKIGLNELLRNAR